jgi:hypothetical protein
MLMGDRVIGAIARVDIEMSPDDGRYAELSRLRQRWTDAVDDVRLAAPRTGQWTEARLVERDAAAQYLRVLSEPYKSAPREPEPPTSN